MDRSMDSIGSCSLDVDAESTDISDTSGSLNFPTPISIKDITREFTNNIRERCSLQTSVKNTTAFVDPVTGQVCIAITQPATTITGTTPIIPVNNNIIRKATYRPVIIGATVPPTVSSSSSVTKTVNAIVSSPQSPEIYVNEKKPSYLNLACCVNGYSNITTYDSKIRQDINKSREVSPIRPSTSALQYCKKSNSLTPPILLTMSNMHGRKSTAQIPGVVSSGMVVNSCNNSSEIDIGARRKHHYMERNGGASVSTSTAFIENGTNEMKKEKENSQSKLSFIQQRVERLYGPGALAQGYYIPKKSKDPDLLYENSNVDGAPLLGENRHQIRSSPSSALSLTKESNQFKKSSNADPIVSFTDCGNDNELVIHDFNGDHNCDDDGDDDDDVIIDLPCLRHLSQEFRAQLPSISPKKQYMVRNGNSQEQQQQQKQKQPQKRSSQTQQLQVSQQQIRNRSKKTLSNGGDSGGDGGDFECTIDEVISIENNSRNYSLDEVDHKISLTLDDNANDNDELKASMSVVSLSKQCDDTVTGPTKSNRNNSAIATADYKPLQKDGHYFLEQLKIEQERLLKLADTGDMYLKMLTEKSNNNEDTLGLLRSASGKARLLVSQKLKQFEGLCYNNLNSTADDKFPTTVDDLQGFWDMVYIQIDQVDSIFRDIEELKANGWKKPTEQLSQYSKNNGNGRNSNTTNNTATRSRSNCKRPNTKLTNGSNISTALSTTSTTGEVKREIQRKKLQELKRRNRAAMMAADDDAANEFSNSIISKNLS